MLRTANLAMAALGLAAATVFVPHTADAATVPGTTLTPSVWLRSDAINGLNAQGNPNSQPANNSAVGIWVDASGNGRNATQGTAARRPVFTTNVVNSKPVVRFDGSNASGLGDFLSFSGALANTAASDLTLFVVSRDTRAGGDSNPKGLISTRDNSGNGWSETYEPGKTSHKYVHVSINPNTLTDSLGADAFHILTTRRDGLNIEYGHDGQLQHSMTLDGFRASLLGATQIGNLNNDINRFFKGDITEIIAFDNNALSSIDRAKIESYLLGKYNIPLANAPVPEPAVAGLFALGGLMTLTRRSRNA